MLIARLLEFTVDQIKELCTAKLCRIFQSLTSNGLYIIIDAYIPTLNQVHVSKLNFLLLLLFEVSDLHISWL